MNEWMDAPPYFPSVLAHILYNFGLTVQNIEIVVI